MTRKAFASCVFTNNTVQILMRQSPTNASSRASSAKLTVTTQPFSASKHRLLGRPDQPWAHPRAAVMALGAERMARRVPIDYLVAR